MAGTDVATIHKWQTTLSHGPAGLWRSAVMAMALLLAVQMAGGVFFGHGRAQAAAGTTFYVDPAKGSDGNQGSAASPFKTLQKALDVVTPGTVIRLASGIYQEEDETVHDGRSDAPVIIEPSAGAKPVMDGKGNTLDAIRLVNDYYIVRGLEIRNVFQGVRIEGATGVTFENNVVHHTSHEAVRLRNFAVKNVVRNNRIYTAGMAYSGTGNGEGIYVGTAPEHRYQNSGLPDTSTGNVITGNEIYNVVEGIDIKEDSSFNYVADNKVYNTTDPNSGGINVRGDQNYVLRNTSYGNAGSGFRFGGDITLSPKYGDSYHYGVDNVLRDNVAKDNAVHAYKFMWGPQDADLSNTGSGYGGQMYYHASGLPSCVYDGVRPINVPVPAIGWPALPPGGPPPVTPAPEPAPAPTVSPAPSPAPAPVAAPAPDPSPSAPLLPAPVIKPVHVPRIIGPRGVVADLVPLLSWAGEPGVTYELEVSRDRLFADAGLRALALAGLTTTSVSVPAGSLRGSTLYFWRVRASNDLGPSRWAIGVFRTPSGPRMSPLPVFGRMVQDLTPTLSWRELRPEATSFDMQMSTNARFATLVLDQGGIPASTFPADTSFVVPSDVLEPNALYFWRVRGANELGVSGWRLVNFRTPAGPRIPPMPLPHMMTPGTQPELQWRVVRDEATSFEVQVSSTPLFDSGSIVFETNGIAAPAFNTRGTVVSLNMPVPLTGATRYYWRVRGVNQFGVSTWREGTFVMP